MPQVDISPGALLTTDYAGTRGICGSRARCAYLREGYLFDCACAGCRGSDALRRLPCPACRPRDSATGLFPSSGLLSTAMEDAAVVVRNPDGSWACGGCGGCFDDAAVDVSCRWPLHGGTRQLRLPSPGSLFEWERQVGIGARLVLS